MVPAADPDRPELSIVDVPTTAAAIRATPRLHPNPTGRPTKYVPATLAALLTAIAEGNKITTACKLAGIGHETYAEWRRRSQAGDPAFVGFVDQVDAAEAEAERRLRQRIEDASTQDWKAAGWLLARRFGWTDDSRRPAAEVAPTTNIQINILTPDRMPALLALLSAPADAAGPAVLDGPQDAASAAERPA